MGLSSFALGKILRSTCTVKLTVFLAAQSTLVTGIGLLTLFHCVLSHSWGTGSTGSTCYVMCMLKSTLIRSLLLLL